MPGDPHPFLMDWQDKQRRKRVRALKQRLRRAIKKSSETKLKK
jgi:hypothetical protein